MDEYSFNKMNNVMKINPHKKYVEEAVISLFDACHSYYNLYKIYNDITTVMPSIKNYVDIVDYLYGKRRKNKAHKKYKMDIEEMLYIEFFTEVYTKHYSKKYSWSDIINNPYLRVPEIMEDFLKGNNNSITSQIIKSFSKYYDNDSSRKVNLEKVHKAMQQISNALTISSSNMEESVEKVLSHEILESLYNNAKQGTVQGAIYIFFKVAQVRKSLTYGRYTNCVTKKNKNGFFNLSCEFNLEELKIYINGKDGIEGIAGLLERYEKTKNDLNKFLK